MQATKEELGFKKIQVRPQLLEEGKTVASLAKTDVMSCSVQVIAKGGETNLHGHAGNDALWLVLQGRAVFYTTGDEVVATLDKNEGLVIPGGAPYWFESGSEDENLVILRFGAQDKRVTPRRIDYTERSYFIEGREGGKRRNVAPKEGVFFGD